MKYACLQESYPRCDYQLWYRKDDEIFEEEVSIVLEESDEMTDDDFFGFLQDSGFGVLPSVLFFFFLLLGLVFVLVICDSCSTDDVDEMILSVTILITLRLTFLSFSCSIF